MKKNNIKIFCFHGKPCAGKDSQAELLADHFPDSEKISTGEIFRGAKSQKGEFGKYYEALKEDIECVNNGGLIRDHIIVPIVGEVIRGKIDEGKKTFIFSGFPRTAPQLNEFNKMVYNLSKNFFIQEQHIFYIISNEIAIERSIKRREKDILKNKEPRKEDEPNTFKKRLICFRRETLPMIQKIKDQETLVIIDASKSINEVSIETLHSLGLLRSSKERK